MEIAADDFAFLLVQASQKLGSLLDVARLLGVQPKQVYLWIANVDVPATEQRNEFEKTLRSLAADLASS